ncbi:MAG: dehydrogenase family protein, partial [Planctomycetota bacterium]
PEATGYGCVYFAQEMLKSRGESFEGKVCTVSGSGNVAQYTVEKLNQLGGKVVSLSDSNGTIYDPEGIDAEKLAFVMELKNIRRGRIKEYAEKFKVEYYEGKRPWGIKCDCALPGATQNEIDGEGAKTLLENGCTLVAEGANMPSSGGVATSGLEMAQNAMRISWSREEVDEKLRNIMIAIHKRCYEAAQEYGQPDNLVMGANIAGFVKVAEAMLDQGLV